MAILGRTGKLLKDSSEIANCKTISCSISADAIKEYVLGATDPDKPAVLESGNKTFEVSVDHIYASNSDFADEILAGNKLTIDVYPEGEGSGNQKITLSNVVLLDWELSVEQEGVEMENVSGKATDITFGTQA